MAHFPLLWSPLLPLVSPSTYLAPSSCVRTVLPSLRLLVNWPQLPHPSPNPPLPSKFPESQLPSALLRRPREYSGSCYPEQLITNKAQITNNDWLAQIYTTEYITSTSFGTNNYNPIRPGINAKTISSYWGFLCLPKKVVHINPTLAPLAYFYYIGMNYQIVP
jgi:hypothetical protein